MKSSSWTSILVLTASAAVVFAGQAGCGSEESNQPKGGLLDGGGTGGGGASGGSGGSATGATGGVNGAHNANLGAACKSDAECGVGLMCLTETSGQLASGSPAHGVCTQACEPSKLTCKNIDAAATCVPFSNNSGYCFEACQIGSPGFGEQKCHGRADMACAPAADMEQIGARCQSTSDCAQGSACLGNCVVVNTACLPQCNSDKDCATGQHCDFGTPLNFESAGVCRTSAPTGLPSGAACDPKATTDPCRGMCYVYSSSLGVCTDGCTLGANAACGWDGAGRANAACFPFPPISGEGAGDAAVCVQLCDCDADCSNPALVCYPFSAGSSLGTKYNRHGVCDAPPTAGAGGLPGLNCGGASTGGAATGGTSTGGTSGTGG